MNLELLFQTQAELDDRIEQEKGLKKQELMDRKLLALQVEIGELANEQRTWKYWSTKRDPVTFEQVECLACNATGDENHKKNIDSLIEGKGSIPHRKCLVCDGAGILRTRNPLLEEYVDGLHFIISIALDLNIRPNDLVVEDDFTKGTVEETFNELYSYVSVLNVLLKLTLPKDVTKNEIAEAVHNIFTCFVSLGEKHLGFTLSEVESAYFEKNKVNHERQFTGY